MTHTREHMQHTSTTRRLELHVQKNYFNLNCVVNCGVVADEPKAGKKGDEKKTEEDGPYCLIRAKLVNQAISTMVANKVISILL